MSGWVHLEAIKLLELAVAAASGVGEISMVPI